MWFMQYLHSTIHFSYRFPFNIFVMFVWSDGTHATMYCTPNVLMILAHSRYTTSEWSIAPFTVWIIWLRIISTTWSQASINDLSSISQITLEQGWLLCEVEKYHPIFICDLCIPWFILPHCRSATCYLLYHSLYNIYVCLSIYHHADCLG